MTSNRIEWKTNDHGEMVGPRIHDAALIELFTGDHVRIVLKRVSGAFVELQLKGLHHQRIDLWNGMIVSAASAWPAANAPNSVWHGLFRDILHAHDEEAHARRLTNEHPASWLFILESSYGGTVVVLCDNIEVFEV